MIKQPITFPNPSSYTNLNAQKSNCNVSSEVERKLGIWKQGCVLKKGVCVSLGKSQSGIRRGRFGHERLCRFDTTGVLMTIILFSDTTHNSKADYSD